MHNAERAQALHFRRRGCASTSRRTRPPSHRMPSRTRPHRLFHRHNKPIQAATPNRVPRLLLRLTKPSHRMLACKNAPQRNVNAIVVAGPSRRRAPNTIAGKPAKRSVCPRHRNASSRVSDSRLRQNERRRNRQRVMPGRRREFRDRDPRCSHVLFEPRHARSRMLVGILKFYRIIGT